MSMTREEAVELLCYGDWLNVISEHIGKMDTERIAEAMSIVGKAFRPVSREQVEKMKGVWIFNDDWWEFWCSKCHKGIGNIEKFKFCPDCGAPMTDEAVDMVMRRLEARHEET